MHPVLASRSRIFIYLVAWAFIAILLGAIVTPKTGALWIETAAITVPICLLYGFVCLSSWYLCRRIPFRYTDFVKLAGTHLAAAAIASVVWVETGALVAMALGAFPYFEGAEERYASHQPTLFLAGALLFLLAVAFNYLLIAEEESQRAERNALEAQVLAREAELKVLRAQIDPHFLFNSLNSINALISADPNAARRMCLLLADFLRGCLKLGSSELIPFREELKLAFHYLDLEKVRLGARLAIECEIDPDCEECLVPPLILQPLVENAVTHGISQIVAGGTLRIEATRLGDFFRIVLENPFEEGASKNGAGVGINNVRMRLMNVFNGDARFDTRQTDQRFRVELQLPAG
jgi:two-component system sensor histidine kinase AlgZ